MFSVPAPPVVPAPIQAPGKPSRGVRPSRRRARSPGWVPRRSASSLRPVAAPLAPEAAPTGVSPERARELLALYAPLLKKIVGGFQRKLPRNVLRDDLMGAATSGLWDAIRRHGATAGDSFEWYVRVRVRGAILDELRAQDWLPRRARAAAASASAQSGEYVAPPAVVRIDDVSEWEQSRYLSESTSGEALLTARSAREDLERAVEQLPDRERHIVSSHYFRGVKFKDLGAELGVSEPRISQLHSRAMQRLRGLMGAA